MSSRAWSNVPIGLIGGAVLLLAAGPVAAQAQSETLTVQARIGDAVHRDERHRWISVRGLISKLTMTPNGVHRDRLYC